MLHRVAVDMTVNRAHIYHTHIWDRIFMSSTVVHDSTFICHMEETPKDITRQ